MRDLELRLKTLRYFSTVTPPDLGADYVMFDLSNKQESKTVAEQYGIMVEWNNPGNRLFMHRAGNRLPSKTPFHFYGDYNTVIIDRDCTFHGALNFIANDNLAVILGGQSELSLDATLYAGDTLVWGKASSAFGVRVWVQGGRVCTISDGCLFSENISIRTTDHHSIIDLTTWQQINRPADITIGRHVWVGPNVRINKGVEIGAGAILAADSVIAHSIPRTEIWGGSPAKMLRKDASWVLSHPVADSREIALLRDLLEDREPKS